MKDFINGDCNEVLKTLSDGSINLFLEDMPYNTTACHWDYEIDLEQYWALRLSKLSDNGLFILTASQPFTTDLIMSNRRMFKYDIVWHKRTPAGVLNAKKMPLRTHETILIFYNKLPSYNPIKTKAKHQCGVNSHKVDSENYRKTDTNVLYKDKHLRYPTSVLDITGVVNNSNEKTNHPTQKPVDLFRYLIKTYTNKGDMVFDGYAGSGTTSIACEIEDRNYTCVEMDKDYYEAAKKRLKQHTDQLTIF